MSLQDIKIGGHVMCSYYSDAKSPPWEAVVEEYYPQMDTYMIRMHHPDFNWWTCIVGRNHLDLIWECDRLWSAK